MSTVHVPYLETPRLIVRGWTDADIEPYADMMSDPHVMRYYARPMERGTAIEAAERARERLALNRYGRFVLERKGEPGYAGMMVLDDIRVEVPFEPKREIGWILPTRVWGKGYAPEAARALLQYAFTELRWPEVVAMTMVPNVPSQRVMEKIGMRRDTSIAFALATMPGAQPEPFLLYRCEANDWRARAV